MRRIGRDGSRGLPEHPLNVTLTSGVDLDPNEYPGELPNLHFLHPAPSQLDPL
jgi:hypothetical protein